MKNSSGPQKKIGNPRWETAVLLLSFMLLWVWWLARHAAQKAGSDLAVGWQVVMVGAVAVLLFVFIRRTKRAVGAMRDAQNPGAGGRAERN